MVTNARSATRLTRPSPRAMTRSSCGAFCCAPAADGSSASSGRASRMSTGVVRIMAFAPWQCALLWTPPAASRPDLLLDEGFDPLEQHLERALGVELRDGLAHGDDDFVAQQPASSGVLPGRDHGGRPACDVELDGDHVVARAIGDEA